MGFLKKLFNHSAAPKAAVTFAWVKDLSGLDDISLIEFATQQLNAECKKNIFNDDQYVSAFFAIDEKIHETVEKITAHYINIDSMSIELEERIANTVFLYHRQLFLIYITLIDNLAAYQPKALNLMMARAIFCATQMIKWRYYNYQSAPANVWVQISKLYLLAEKNSLLEVYIQTYKDQEVSTLASAYIHACMLGSLESLSFKHQQIELVSKMLAHWTPKILIQNTYDEKKHLFYVDTNGDAPARRIRNFKPADSYRHWCFDSINTKIELCLSLLEFNIDPKQQFMKDLISHKYALATLEVLRTEWSRVEYKRQRRRDERIKTTKAATTIYGFDDICSYVELHTKAQAKRGEKILTSNKSFDERLSSHSVSNHFSDANIIYVDLGAGQSNIVDESTHGIGLYISKAANEVSLGMMICVSAQDQKNDIRVGVIRSVKPIIGNELHIGVEILSKSAFCVDAKNMSMKPAANSNLNDNAFSKSINFSNEISGFTCLYIPQEFTIAKQESLIIPRLHYNKNDTYQVNVLDNNILVKFTETLEQHENWLRVAYAQEVSQLAA